ncbi:MAG TPA: M4 family metallopeptidase [Gemmatimonadales bacterium]
MMPMCTHCCFIVAPGMLRRLLLDARDDATRQRLIYAVETSSFLRGHRVARQGAIAMLAPGTKKSPGKKKPEKDRSVYDAEHRRQLPGPLVRAEGDKPVADAAANAAYDNAGKTWDFYETILGRNSIDGRGLEIVSSVHYGEAYNNAMWNGDQMVYGDGDGKLFLGFVNALDVVGHELTHGVTQYTIPGGLLYQGLSGALNESISDVFGSVIKQWSSGQTVDQADWLIGTGILAPGLGKALRSMARPGTAWIHDDQPDNMSSIDPDADVHTNSGVPNRAFYLAATALGGHSWEKAAPIWYGALPKLSSSADFSQMRKVTASVAKTMFDATTAAAINEAWDTVGVS